MVYVIVPAYNEAPVIGRVIRGLFSHGFKNVVVVDDGSNDATAATARETGATVLHHLVNRGQGAALETGTCYALAQGAEYVVHFDGDDQFNAADIAPALTVLKTKQLAMVFGSRFLDTRSQVPRFKRMVLLPVARLVNYLITGVRLTDAHNGFRIFTRSAAPFVHIDHAGMAHNTEILAKVAEARLPFAEVPVAITYHEYGQGLGGGLRVLWDLFMGRLF